MLKKGGMLLHIRPFFLICVIKHAFFLDNLQISQLSVSLQCVFHSIRFKVNKGWSTAVLLFYARTLRMEQNQSFFTISLLSPVVCCDNIVKRIRVSFFWLHE